ncbi:general odorant-binding protein 99a-like [Episyrphus balteatus]|uniref:general odorant-binding protein 99a-like n=1 Tax=Episyrphus balteatus TaxID=286459 RepID=UPI00248605E4|nr:general odorant-binding protein 99a-like [Episyrphus balteatus]
MKFFIILALVALASATKWKPKTYKEWQEVEVKCEEQHKVSPEIKEKAKIAKYLPKEQFEKNLCYMRGAELWNDSKGYNVDGMITLIKSIPAEENIDKDSQIDIFMKCIDNNSEGSNPIDWAYRGYKCFRDNGNLYTNLGKGKYYEEPEQ